MTAYSVPSRVAFVIPDDTPSPRVFLMPLPDGPPVHLDGTAAAIWILAADGEPDVAAGIGEMVGLDREVVADDVERFLAELLARGLLWARMTTRD